MNRCVECDGPIAVAPAEPPRDARYCCRGCEQDAIARMTTPDDAITEDDDVC